MDRFFDDVWISYQGWKLNFLQHDPIELFSAKPIKG
jgi:hypothetical protein